jgi:hypothetical protein
VYPALQKQFEIVVLAAGEKLPVGHDRDGPLPDEFLYVPAGLAVQDPAIPVYPALQVQVVDDIVPETCVALFAGQSEQVPSPSFALNLPGAHAVQVVLVFVYPALQVQLAELELPCHEYEFAVQLIQTFIDVPPLNGKYVFEGQLSHIALAFVLLYLPGEHAKH